MIAAVPLLLIIAMTGLPAFAQTPPPETGPPAPRSLYLMPITAYRPLEESVEKLLGNRWGHGTMIYQGGNSSENDFVVSVWGSDNKPKALTLIRFEPTGGRGEVAKAKSEIDVPIDTDFADAIYKAWRAMLLKTRYPDKLPVCADAPMLEFSAWIAGAGGAYGEAGCSGGFQDELMAFGFKLKDYCTSKDAERKTIRDLMIPRLQDFAARVEHSRLY